MGGRDRPLHFLAVSAPRDSSVGAWGWGRGVDCGGTVGSALGARTATGGRPGKRLTRPELMHAELVGGVGHRADGGIGFVDTSRSWAAITRARVQPPSPPTLGKLS